MNTKNLIVIPAAIIAMLYPVYFLIYWFKSLNRMELAVMMAIALLVILVSVLVLFNIKPTRALKALGLAGAILVTLLFLAIAGLILYRFISGARYPDIYFFIGFCLAVADILITMLVYIIRNLKITGRTLLIAAGIACAAISATGIIWYHNQSVVSGPAASKLISRLRQEDLDTRGNADIRKAQVTTDELIEFSGTVIEVGPYTQQEAVIKVDFYGHSIIRVKISQANKVDPVIQPGKEAVFLVHDPAQVLSYKDVEKAIGKYCDFRLTRKRNEKGRIMFQNLENIASIINLRRQLHDKNPEMRCKAINALGRMNDKESIPKITNLLKNDNPDVRMAAFHALCTLGASKAIPEIIKATKNDNLSSEFRFMLFYLDPKEVIPEVIELLQDGNTNVRKTALEILCHGNIKESIPQIKELLKDTDNWMRHLAEDALKKLGVPETEIEQAKFKTIVDVLFNNFMDERFIEPRFPVSDGWEMPLPSGKVIFRSDLREQAAPIIACGPDAVPHLFKWLKTDSLHVRYIAVYSLEQITGIDGRIPTFATTKEVMPYIEEAIAAWQEWYDNQKAKEDEASKVDISKASELIIAHIFKQTPAMNHPSVHFQFIELPIDDLFQKMGWQIFKNISNVWTGYTYIISKNKVFDLFDSLGGSGLDSACVSDIDQDGQYELIYTFSGGSGIHFSVVGLCYKKGDSIEKSGSNLTYLNGPWDLFAWKENDQKVVIEIGKNIWKFGKWERLTALGTVKIENKDGKLSCIIEEKKDLPDEFEQYIYRPQQPPDVK